MKPLLSVSALMVLGVLVVIGGFFLDINIFKEESKHLGFNFFQPIAIFQKPYTINIQVLNLFQRSSKQSIL